jgi:ppGpp synthetase/RelA/SpoT-type nucleotidyltranferase
MLVADPLSTAQLERLGKRLIASDGPIDDDLQLLHRLLVVRSDLLKHAIARVRDGLGFAPTSRVKNTGTILEKLRRQGGWTLGGMQDLAGMRIVGEFDRRGQDAVVDQISVLFAGEARPPRIIDRRAEPMHGYRAVHVIVFPEGAPIEIQVRTLWQHEWAELFEKLADRVGRAIRYGERPRQWWTDAELEEMSAHDQMLVGLRYRIRESTVDIALATAAMIAAVEEGELERPPSSQLGAYREGVDEQLRQLREAVEELAEY